MDKLYTQFNSFAQSTLLKSKQMFSKNQILFAKNHENSSLFKDSFAFGIKLMMIGLLFVSGLKATAQCDGIGGSSLDAGATVSTCGSTSTVNSAPTGWATIGNLVNGYSYTISSTNGTFITLHQNTYNGTVITSGNSPLSFTSNFTGTGAVVVYPDNTCSNTWNFTSSVLTYQVTNAPIPTPTVNASTSVSCTGMTVNWSATSNTTSYLLDISTSSTFAAGSFVNTNQNYLNYNPGNVTSYPVTGLASNTTYYIRVRAQNTSCSSSTSAYSGTVSTLTYTTPTVTPGATITTCTGTAAITLSGASAAGNYSGTPTWTGSGGTFVQNANPALATFTPSTASGSITATLSVTGANSCSNASNTRTITWGTAPAATAGSNITTCTGTAAITMSGATASGTYTSPTWSGGVGSGAWIQDANPALAQFVPTVASGSFTATLTLTGTNGCGNATATRTITWGTATSATAGADISSCTGTNAITLTGATASGTFSSPPVWSGAGPGTFTQDANPALATFTPSSPSGSFTATLTLTGINGCSNSTATRVITWGTAPTATAGSNINTCTGTSAITLTGASASGTYSGTPTWSGGGGLGTFTQNADPALAIFTPTVSSGSFTATLSLTGSNGCSNTSATRVISWGVQPVANAGGTITTCTGTSAITMTGATATGTYSGTPIWSGGVGLGAWSQDAVAADAYFVPTTPSGSFTATLTLTGINGCTNTTSTRTISWGTQPVAYAGTDITTCTGSNAITLSGATASGSYSGNPIWSGAGPGTFTQNSNPALATFTPTFNSGSFVATLTLTGINGCTNATSTRNVVWGTAPIAVAGPAINSCTGTSPITLSGASASGAYSGTPTWSGGVGLGTFTQDADPALAVFTPSVSSGSFTATLSLTATSGCGNTTDTRVISWGVQPTVDAGNDYLACSGTAPILQTGASATGTFSSATWTGGIALGFWTQNADPALATFTPSVPSNSFTATLTLVGSNGCSNVTDTKTIGWQSSIANNTITAPSTTVLCGASDPGNISGTTSPILTGGSGIYNFQWQQKINSGSWTDISLATNSDYDPSTLAIDTHRFRRVVDAGACNDTSNVITIIIEAPISNNILTFTGVSAFCTSGNPDPIIGSVPVTPVGPFTYQWQVSTDNGQTWNNISLATLIDYNPPTITTTTLYRRAVTSSSCTGYSNEITITINQTPVITSVTKTNVLCNGNSDGTITINANGGTSPLQYSVNNGVTFEANNTIDSLAIGTYDIVVTDANSCSISYSPSITITEPTILVITASGTDASCSGVFDGTITASSTGGIGNNLYSLNGGPGQASGNFTGLAAGNYIVYVTNGNLCVDTQLVVINNTYAVTGVLLDSTNVSCFGGNDGTATVDLFGGVLPYSFSINGFIFQSTPTFTGLTANNYTATLRDSKGCTAYVPVNITQPALLQARLDSVVNNQCSGGATGGIYITPIGGTLPYSFLWTNNGTTEDITNLSAGVYNVIVTDSNGCTASTGASITQPLQLFASIASFTDVACNGDSTGKIDISANGGVPPYSFSWSNGATGEDLLNIPVGTYSVTVSDANNCSAIASQTIGEPTILSSTIAPTSSLCNGNASGALDLGVTGGRTPYTYYWSNGATTEDLSGVNAGTYSVLITDKNGCTTSNTGTITQPLNLAVTGVVTNVTCNGGNNGEVNTTISGGTSPYNVSWSNLEVTEDITNLIAGNYTILVTDDNGCTTTATYTVSEPAVLTASATTTNVSCNGGATGAINLTVSGGTMGYTYLWSTGAGTEDISGLTANTSYDVTITDANGCTTVGNFAVTQPNAITSSITGTGNLCAGDNSGSADLTVGGGTAPYTFFWSNFSTTEDLAGLSGGKYIVIITDNNGCTKRDSVSVAEPAPLVLSTVVTNVSCNGGTGSVDLTVTGGTGTYTYNWSNSTALEDLAAVAAGTYTVVVADANGCSATASVTVTQPTAIVFNATTLNVACNGGGNGQIDITVGGGVFPYSFAWSNLATTEDLFNLSGGTYTVTITDANNCTASASYTITEPNAITSSTTHTDVSCAGAFNGSVDLTVAGGAAPYTYFWSNFANTQDLANIAGGKYIVIITDANGCTKRDSVSVAEPTPLVLSTVVTNVSCNGGTGSVDLTVTGGTGTYTYNWSNSTALEDLAAVAAGTYTVVVADANGCSATASVTVTQPSAIVFNATTLNVACNGGGNGQIDITVGGGVFPYSFAWSNLATTEDLFNLSGGTYTVTITDANNCTASASYTITEPNAITSSTTHTDVSCAGAFNGSVDLTVAGGAAPYTYFWSNFANTQDLANIAGGKYIVIITDANGCTKRDSVSVAEPTPLVLSTVVTNVSCNGGTGSVDLTVTGGTGTYTYNWSNSTSLEDLAAVAAGTYTVVVADANGCSATASVTVTQPTAIVFNATTLNVACNGGGNGQIDITVGGGVFPYSFAWSNLATTEDLFNLSGGTYTVTITDANNCTASASYTITEPNAITSSTTHTDVSCAGAFNGSVDLTVAGGAAPYTYFWSNFANTQDLANIAGGKYIVIITDANGCTKRDSVSVAEPAPLVLSTVVTNVSCNGGTGSVDLTVTGGTGTYTYNWSNSTALEDLAAVAAGTYTVVVADANGCSATASVTVTQPTAIVFNATTLNVACNGGGNGQIDITVGGGVFPYSFAWSNLATTEDLFNLSGGTYTVTITDANNCTASASYTITEPNAITSSTTHTDVSCAGAFNGSVDLTVAGGAAPYTYFWSNFANTQDLANIAGGKYIVIITDANGCTKRDSVSVAEPAPLVLSTVVTNVSCNGGTGSVDLTVTGGTGTYTYNWSNSTALEDLAAVAAGTYTVVVADANGCSATASVTVTQPTAIVFNATTLNVACNGGGNGQIDITVGGGVFPYSFAWSNLATTEDLFNLSGGTYTVTITDANNCTASASYTITEPNAITSSTTHTDVSCAGAFNGSVDLTVAGGAAPYTYFWSNFANTQDLANIAGGKYIVIITDANGCTKRDSVSVAEPTPLVLSTVVTNVSCNGGTGSVDLTVTGGTGTYTYNWSNSTSLEDLAAVAAGTYTVVVADANGCSATASVTVTQPTAIVVTSNAFDVTCAGASNGSIDLSVFNGTPPYTFTWNNSATSEDLFNLSGGNYGVTIADANGCTTTQSFTINEPVAITSSITPVNATCNGAATGSADLTVGGGTAPYTYSWSNFTAAQDISNVPAGTYYVIITDAKNCTKRDSVTVTDPSAIVLSATITNVNCNTGNNGAIDLSVSGGTGGYTYNWSNSATTQDISGLAAATYTVTVTDGNGCTTTGSYTIAQPITLVLTGSAYNAVCANTATGSVDITVGGGTLPYTFAWSNTATTEDIINVAAATYTVTVTDANGCTISSSFVIGQPSVLTSGIVGTNVTCNGANNGAADLTVSGGVSPYTYLWSSFVGSQDVSGLDGGLYIVIITDAKGCTKRDSILIVEPQPLTLSTTVQQISCFNANDGSINLIVSGGTAPFNYSWNNSATSANISNLAGGTYSVIVSDANGCTATTSAIIINPLPLGLNSVVTKPKCFGFSNGAIDIIVSGGSPGYSYNWSNSQTSEDIAGLAAGTYKLTITDTRGCTKTDSIIVSEPNPLFSTGFITNVSCFGAFDGFVDITAYGGTLPYDFKWSTSSITEDIGTLSGGNYTVTVTDANLCTSSALYVVNEPPVLTLNVTGTNVTCNGGGNATLQAIAGGGLPPYEYLWNNFSVSATQTNVPAGQYTVLLTDSNGCNTYDTITITEPTAVLITGIATNASCNGNADGTITLTVSGGTGSYTYNWSNSANTKDVTGLAAGNYGVTVTDVNGCSKTLSFTISQSGALASNLSISNPICNGGSTGFASLIVTNGDAPYSYNWSSTPAQTGATATNLTAGTYIVTATDAKGCILIDTAVITEPAKISITTNVTGSKCSNNGSGTVSVSVAGGQGPYTYILNSVVQTTGIFTGLTPGTYSILVKDANSCENSATFTITAPSNITVSLSSDKQSVLSGMPVQLTADANSTSPIINYYWSPLGKGNFDYSGCGDTLNCSSPSVAPATTTTFTVVAMDADSCTASDTITISILNQESNFMPTAFSPNGDGLNDRFEFDILGCTTANVRIYDRWGQLLYSDAAQPNGITGNKGWDGTFKGSLVEFDTYVYQLIVTYFDGAEKQMTGTFTLMK